jgi:hypothetical protein
MKIGGRTTARYAHRMVAEAFLGPIPEGMQVNHKDGNRSNCDVSNLEVVTNSENRAHAYRVLGVPPNRGKTGEAHHNSKLTWLQVCEIRERHSGGENTSELSRRYGISRQGVYRIVSGRVRRDG